MSACSRMARASRYSTSTGDKGYVATDSAIVIINYEPDSYRPHSYTHPTCMR